MNTFFYFIMLTGAALGLLVTGWGVDGPWSLVPFSAAVFMIGLLYLPERIGEEVAKRMNKWER